MTVTAASIAAMISDGVHGITRVVSMETISLVATGRVARIARDTGTIIIKIDKVNPGTTGMDSGAIANIKIATKVATLIDAVTGTRTATKTAPRAVTRTTQVSTRPRAGLRATRTKAVPQATKDSGGMAKIKAGGITGKITVRNTGGILAGGRMDTPARDPRIVSVSAIGAPRTHAATGIPMGFMIPGTGQKIGVTNTSQSSRRQSKSKIWNHRYVRS